MQTNGSKPDAAISATLEPKLSSSMSEAESEAADPIERPFSQRDHSIQYTAPKVPKKTPFKSSLEKGACQVKDDLLEEVYDELPFKCPYCPRGWKSNASMGGHISRAHQGMSTKYAKKI